MKRMARMKIQLPMRKAPERNLVTQGKEEGEEKEILQTLVRGDSGPVLHIWPPVCNYFLAAPIH